MSELTFPVRYYRIHPYGVGMAQPAKAFLGYAEKRITVPLAEAALVLVHHWNEGFPEGLSPWLEHPECNGYLEYVTRARPIIEEHVVPLLADARRAGLTVVHLVSGPYAEKYPQYQATKELAGPEPEPEPGSVRTDWMRERAEECYGPGFWEHHPPTTDTSQPRHRDIPECVRPLPDEIMAANGRQLNRVLRERGIWTLLYTGFLTNVCLTHSPGAMIDMINRGYRCVVLRDCTTSGEQADTVDEMLNYRAAIRYFEYTLAYSALSKEVRRGLGQR
jgi:nicotinamidase-related amidase